MRRSFRRQWLAGLAILSLAACAPVAVNVDTPKEGQKVAVGVGQEMRVNWPNMHPEEGSWTLETSPASPALNVQGREVTPAGAGAQQLETFRFAGANAGRQTLTFVYQHRDGTAPLPEERVTLAVEVS